jgi:hypothetical protein
MYNTWGTRAINVRLWSENPEGKDDFETSRIGVLHIHETIVTLMIC